MSEWRAFWPSGFVSSLKPDAPRIGQPSAPQAQSKTCFATFRGLSRRADERLATLRKERKR